MGIAFVKSPGDEKHNIIDHVSISIAYKPVSAKGLHKGASGTARDVVKELAERFYGICPQEVELVNEDLGCLLSNCRGGNRGVLVCEEVAVVCR